MNKEKRVENISSAKMIPVNVITGFLGVGKTSFILELLKNKGADQNWAVLVNEFGKVGIDQATFKNQDNKGVAVKEVMGGCICCSANDYFLDALQYIVEEVKPDRILIEPSGTGFLLSIQQILNAEKFKGKLKLGPTLCLVDPKMYIEKRIQMLPIFKAQIDSADILIASKTDLCSEEELQGFFVEAGKYLPPKLYIGKASFGQINPEILDLESSGIFRTGINNPHSANFPSENEKVIKMPFSLKSKFNRYENNQNGFYSCGWIFKPEIVFYKTHLVKLLENNKGVLRIKGVVNTNEGWLLVNISSGTFTSDSLEESGDSRIELITYSGFGFNIDKFESELSKAIN